MEEVIAPFDLHSFAYLLMASPRDGNCGLISNYSSTWTTVYLKSRYQDLDPVIIQAVRQSHPFVWGAGLLPLGQSEGQDRFFAEAAEFGLRHGLTIPIHSDRCGIAAVTFAADHYLAAFQHCVDVHLPLLQLISTLFHRYANRSLRPRRSIGDIALTEREFQCLSWAAEGKTAWEIGQILSVSRRTVAFHLDNVRAKLGVSTVTQAVARFVSDSR